MTRRRWVALVLALAGLAAGARGAWIPAKAGLAQVLLHHAWERARAGETRPAPWPGADTWPVARLTAPARGRTVYVLAGASGRTLAFGPGHVAGTARPGTIGNCALAGHRDTHFAFLKELEPGEDLVLETAAGDRFRYRVEEALVVHETETWVLDPVPDRILTLVTCHPFDRVIPGGAMRYVVRAVGGEGTIAPPPRGPRLGLTRTSSPGAGVDTGAPSPPGPGGEGRGEGV